MTDVRDQWADEIHRAGQLAVAARNQQPAYDGLHST